MYKTRLQISELSDFSNKSMFLKIKKISAHNLSGGADTQNFSHTQNQKNISSQLIRRQLIHKTFHIPLFTYPSHTQFVF